MHTTCIMRTVILTQHAAPIRASGCPRLDTSSVNFPYISVGRWISARPSVHQPGPPVACDLTRSDKRDAELPTAPRHSTLAWASPPALTCTCVELYSRVKG